ncbi:uncharacterized protein RJT21DRAFT_21035 [Scheffersomyces amazonensis]|uniref:uncharacterized protein n=1 Tax=Scheffersomyces amazonensis TaxID=1078765 RepID=UPI00315C8AF1
MITNIIILAVASFIVPVYAVVNPSSYLNFQPLVINTPIIEVVGNKLFNVDSGQQFFIKGIAYQKTRQPGEVYDGMIEPYIDPLSNTQTCLRDIQYFKALGVNTIRVYQVNPASNHDICMNSLANAGIYVIADLSEPSNSIDRSFPTWDITLYDRYTSVIDSLIKYPNTLAFIAGNEVANSQDTTDTAPFIKASIRDMKNYIISKGYRSIPVGYSSNDDAGIRKDLADYLVCKTSSNDNSAAEFIGLNIYEWCGYSTYATSGYRDLTYQFSEFPVPIMMSEYGCNTVRPRPFTEVEALYGSTMSKVWSGGIAYEYFEEVNNYGVVIQNPDGSISQYEDFSNLASKLNSINPISISLSEYGNLTQSFPTCQAPTPEFQASTRLPNTPNKDKCTCLQASLSCVVNPYMNVNINSLFSEVCGNIDCSDISNNGYDGIYGAFSDCSSTQKLSYILNKYYISRNRDPTACNFSGRATLITNVTDLNDLKTPDGKACAPLIENSKSYNLTFESSKSKELLSLNETKTSPTNPTLDHYSPNSSFQRRNSTSSYTSSGAIIINKLSEYLIQIIASLIGTLIVI